VAATHPSRSRHAARPLRPGTYARRRAAAALAFLALVALAAAAVLGFLGGGPLAAPEPSSAGAVRTVAARTYVVQPGDTLWSIARRAQPTGDVRRLVDDLGRAHGSGALQVGERLVVP
jgi:nucleoid-associated protein YgaU